MDIISIDSPFEDSDGEGEGRAEAESW